MRFALILILAVGADPIAAEEREAPLSFYVGQYRVIGTGPGGPVDYPLRLDEVGLELKVSLCRTEDGGSLVPLKDEGWPYFEGRIGPEPMICEPFWNYDNYPVVLCYGDTGSRLTLWPAGDFAAPLACSD